MLFYDTIESNTLTLLKRLFQEPIFSYCRLVGGTSLALQYGHGFYKMKYANHSLFRALMSLTYFDDAKSDPMPTMINDVKWEVIKQYILDEVSKYKNI